MTTDSIAICDMLERCMLRRIDDKSIDAFLEKDGLQVLFFPGGRSQRGEAHDVAVALREILKDYSGQVTAALVESADGDSTQQRFRVLALPSLVLLVGGEVLEVIPRVKDWGDYVKAFRRYLGSAGGGIEAVESQA